MGYPPPHPPPLAHRRRCVGVWLQASQVKLSAIEEWVQCDVPVMLDVAGGVDGAVAADSTVFGAVKLGVGVEGNIEAGTGGEAECIRIARER